MRRAPTVKREVIDRRPRRSCSSTRATIAISWRKDYVQPEVVGHTLANYIDMAAERVALPMKLPLFR